jgi:PleD family two-component response regulator
MSVARKILAEACRPFDLNGVPATIGVSIGVTVYHPGEDTTADMLLRAADEGMYKAKAAGKAQIYRLDLRQPPT